MTKNETQTYRQRLLSLQSRLTGDVSHLAGEALRTNQKEASGNLSSVPLHPADLGSDSFEQEFTLNLLASEEQALDEVAAALGRLDRGTFGVCEECGGEIPRPRLTALPHTRYCVACARKLEHRT